MDSHSWLGKIIFTSYRFAWSLGCVLFLINFNIEAQNHTKTDSLKAAIKLATSDVEKVDLYNQLAWEYHQISVFDTFFLYAEQAHVLSQKISYIRGTATSLNQLGLYHYITGNYGLAIAHCQKALQISKKAGYLKEVADALNYMGLVYINQGDFVKSIQLHHEFMEISREINNQQGVADAHLSIGLAYLRQKEFDKALNHYRKSLEIQKQIDNKTGIAHALSNIGTIYKEKNDPNKALEYMHQALEIRKQAGDERGIIYSLNDIANTYAKIGQPVQALEHLKDALKIAQALQYKWGMSYVLLSIGNLYQKQQQPENAKQALQQCLDIAMGIRALDQAEEASRLLCKISYQKGEYKDATKYQELSILYGDSLKREDQGRTLAQMESNYEIARKEAENKLLAQENFMKSLQLKRQNTIFLSVLIVLGLLIGFLYALYRVNIRRKYANKLLIQKNQEINLHKEEIMAQSEQILQQNRELAKANEVLAELNQEKDNLIGVVAHDLRSPLNKVKGLTELIPLSGPVNNEQDFYLKMIDEVVDSGNRLIAELLEVSNLDSFNTQFHIAPLELYGFTEELIHTYELPAQKKQIKINLLPDEEEMIIHTDRDALRRILENLLSNALKFSPTNHQVQVKLRFHEKVTQISIKDEGPGIYKDDRHKLFKKFQKLSAKPTGGESSTGLGLYIVKVLTERLGGTVSVISEPGQGAEFIVKIPTCRNEIVNE